MPAQFHLVTGSPHADQRGYLLERAAECLRSHPTSVLWLVPTRRHAEALLSELAAQGAGPLPHVRTFTEFAEQILATLAPEWQPLPNVQRRLVIDELLAGVRERAESRGLAEGVAALFAELQREAIEPPEFAHALSLATSEEQQGLPHGRLYAEYVNLLRRMHLLDADQRNTHACRLLEGMPGQPTVPYRGICVEGFATLTRSQLQLLQSLAAAAENIWIAFPLQRRECREDLSLSGQALVEFVRGRGESAHWVERVAVPSEIPTGLVHLERQLFRPVRIVEKAAAAEGLMLLEGPGLLGEARLVARQIKALLLQGVPAGAILVTARDLVPYADLLREVFAEYGIPVDVEGVDALHHHAPVRVLLRALRLPDEDWPFAGVTALLRSGYFSPTWPEAAAADTAAQAEVLLRLLEEPRGRESYLHAVRRWADRPEPGLEDEQAEESRRQHTHELAVRCRPFLERFFRAWDEAPHQAPLRDHVAWLRKFADDVGLTSSCIIPREAAALARLWQELQAWCRLDQRLNADRSRSRKEFLRGLWTIAAEVGLARSPRGPGRVRVLSAELARGLPVAYLFLLGLGERSFPRLSAPDIVLGEAERLALRRAGLRLRSSADALPEEMLLFYELAAQARQCLVLSYPAVDEKGQALLPSSFLTAVFDCFEPGAIPVERRSMLLDRYQADPPLSPAEQRVQRAARMDLGRELRPGNEQEANLVAAQRMIRQRLFSRDFSPYDGAFRHPAILAELRQLYGPERVFSPTALEEYVACPFRFFLGNVLRLAPLEDPREEIEVTRRGQAFHRALARMHQRLKAAGVDGPADGLEENLATHLGDAVAEYAARASSPASKELWRLEGERLKRLARRYGRHWHSFLEPWQETSAVPRPHSFEIDFGLPAADGAVPLGPLIIRTGDVEVRVSGRIDRIDVAPLEGGLGYWVIDYKTGRADHYRGADLVQYRRLQLTLYALAVEQVVLADKNARPLGLAYWLLGDRGPRIALPERNKILWFEESAKWREVREELQEWIVTLVDNIRRGVFPLKPRSDHCTQTCDFGQVCRIAQSRRVPKDWKLPLPNEE